jgi:hypothetical protein
VRPEGLGKFTISRDRDSNKTTKLLFNSAVRRLAGLFGCVGVQFRLPRVASRSRCRFAQIALLSSNAHVQF